MYREFIDALEDRGIDVWTTDSSAGSHSFWMAYRTHAGDWGGVASEVETVIDAWCDTEPGADQVFIEIAEPDETPRQTIAAIHFWESDGVCDMSDRERMTFILGQFDTDH